MQVFDCPVLFFARLQYPNKFIRFRWWVQMIFRASTTICILSLFAIWIGGCTPAQYAEQADKDAYKTLRGGEKRTFGEAAAFDVDYKPLGGGPNKPPEPIHVGDKVIGFRKDPTQLTVNDCLQIAFRNSRTYQNQKETLYLSALDLANTRRGWNIPLLGGDIDADASFERIRKLGTNKSAAAGIGPTLTQQFVNGGVLTLAATLDWLSDISMGEKTNVVSSLIQANFTQPLLRGAWRGLAFEDQYRRERDFLFAVFTFDRYRQTFASGIYSSYYSVLRQCDQLANEKANIERLYQTYLVTKAKSDEGKVSRIETDQAESDWLTAQVAYLRSQQTFQNSLDSFKITLGLPIKANIGLNYPQAWKELNAQPLKILPFKEDDAVDIALTVRPDVLTERAGVRDAERNLVIAADQFNPQLDLAVGLDVGSRPPTDFTNLQFHHNTKYAGVTFNYALDQTDNRDAYRTALIACDRAFRDLTQFIDEVRLDVRESYRQLQQSRESYEMQVRNLQVAKRRSLLAAYQQEENLANARDVLEAEQTLLNAQNGQTRSRITYATTRTNFLATMGMLYVDKKGLIHEREKPAKFDRIQQFYPYVGEAGETKDTTAVRD